MNTLGSISFVAPLMLPPTWTEHRQAPYYSSSVTQLSGQMPPSWASPTISSGAREEAFSSFEAMFWPIDRTAVETDRRKSVTAGRLIGYLDLPLDWDGDGGRRPSLEAIDDAIQMLNAVPTNTPAPKAMILADGDVALYWDNGETYAEIGFDGSGKYYAYAEGPDLTPVHLDGVPLYEDGSHISFPDDVSNILNWADIALAA